MTIAKNVLLPSCKTAWNVREMIHSYVAMRLGGRSN